ncbi:hypothetical protein CHARACLAT_018706 [Characodon lateralis]|uniref:Uncharacterized protein n=1 Tax=Characodon lateralis TaxID=208331 RepID=A0ABU7EAR6_9TELE|nr:hypothetical protein [Characodon lateralis]
MKAVCYLHQQRAAEQQLQEGDDGSSSDQTEKKSSSGFSDGLNHLRTSLMRIHLLHHLGSNVLAQQLTDQI